VVRDRDSAVRDRDSVVKDRDPEAKDCGTLTIQRGTGGKQRSGTVKGRVLLVAVLGRKGSCFEPPRCPPAGAVVVVYLLAIPLE